MANANTFFDVLIDQLIEDVRREFETTAPPAGEFDDPKKVVVGLNDMVAQMIGFRARMEQPTTNAMTRAYGRPAPRFNAEDVEAQLQTKERSVVQPGFASGEAQIAFALVAKAGAKFYGDDLVSGGVSRDALKRERRRVLLTLHPDRAPETERKSAHEKFLAAAEAFSTLAETATSLNQAA